MLLRGLPDDSLAVRRLVRESPPPPDSPPLDPALLPLTQQLLGIVAEGVLVANWQRAGGKGKAPRLFPEATPPNKFGGVSNPTLIDRDDAVARLRAAAGRD